MRVAGLLSVSRECRLPLEGRIRDSYTFRLRRSLNLGMASVGNSRGELGIRGDLAVGASVASFEEFFRAEQLRLHQVLFAITGSRGYRASAS